MNSVEAPALAQVEQKTIKRQSQETASQAEALFQKALLISDDQEGDTACRQLQEAMSLWIQIREASKAAMAALQMGDHYRKVRNYQDALSCYRLAIDVKPPSGVVKANALNSIALIYAELYLNNIATRYFNDALRQATVINDFPAQMLALTGLADISQREGEFVKAHSYIGKALQLSEKNHAEADPALLYLSGQINREEGLVENARIAFEKALAIYRNTGSVVGQVRVLCALSGLSLLVLQKRDALEQSELALKLSEEQVNHAIGMSDVVSARELRWPALFCRARAERALGQKERALDSFRKVTSDIKILWWTVYIATEASAVGFREEVQAVYREYVDLLIEEGKTNKAYDSVEEGKARTLLTFTGARRRSPSVVESKQKEALRDLSRSMADSRRLLLTSGLSRERQATLQKKIESTESQMDEIRLQIQMKHSKDRLVWSDLATVDQLQKLAAKDQITLAEFSLGEKRSFLWLFTRGEVLFEVLPARKEIEQAVRPFLELLGAPPNPLYVEKDITKLKALSEALFATLFGSLSSQIDSGQRLIIVADGLLHYLPFEALIRKGHYLVEDHVISYLPSASILLQLQNSKDEIQTADKMELLAFGDPIFSSEQKAPLAKKRANNPVNVVRAAPAASGLGLPPLPRTRDEVQHIASIFPAERTRLYLGKESTEDAVKRESLRRYRRIHFATHSLTDDKFPARSAVVLTQNEDPNEDGFLEVSEISDLKLDSDLVVLSACQTGRGQLLSGEGIIGLSRAFLYAGARSVVVSLWNVSDISTGQLMENFYRHQTVSIGNAAALKAAKLEMLKSDKVTRHPYYWSAFVIVGKP